MKRLGILPLLLAACSTAVPPSQRERVNDSRSNSPKRDECADATASVEDVLNIDDARCDTGGIDSYMRNVKEACGVIALELGTKVDDNVAHCSNEAKRCELLLKETERQGQTIRYQCEEARSTALRVLIDETQRVCHNVASFDTRGKFGSPPYDRNQRVVSVVPRIVDAYTDCNSRLIDEKIRTLRNR